MSGTKLNEERGKRIAESDEMRAFGAGGEEEKKEEVVTMRL